MTLFWSGHQPEEPAEEALQGQGRAAECKAIVRTALLCVLAVLPTLLEEHTSTVVAELVTQLKPSVHEPQIAVAITHNAFQVRVCVAGRELEQSYQVQ